MESPQPGGAQAVKVGRAAAIAEGERLMLMFANVLAIIGLCSPTGNRAYIDRQRQNYQGLQRDTGHAELPGKFEGRDPRLMYRRGSLAPQRAWRR